MAQGFSDLLAVAFATAGERSQKCLLLGSDAQDRVPRLKKLLDKMSQMAELLAAMRRIAAGQHLEHLAPGHTEPIENPSHETGSGTAGLCLQALGNLLGCQSRP